MPSGSCLCGNVKINYTGDAQTKALCHCVDCKKITGSTYSTNVIVPAEGFSFSGTPKDYAKTADSGNKITSHFCPDCGTTLARSGATFPGVYIVKAGVLDESLESVKPDVELYAPERVSWVAQVGGTNDVPGMP